MLKKTIKYEDYNGVERNEDFYFNLSEAEIMEMELSVTGGLTEMINKIVTTQDGPAIIKLFKDLVLRAYGEKSADGKRIFSVMGLAAKFGDTLKITVDGKDEEKAANELKAFFENNL